MSINVFINDKSHFKSKNSIEKFKKAIKNKEEIDPSRFFNEGYNFQFKKQGNDKIDITVMTQDEYQKIERRKNLKMKLKNAQYSRSSQPKRKMDSLKRSIPDNIFKAYSNIIKKYQFNIPAPDEVINNLEKYKLQVSMLMDTNQKISNDMTANNMVKKYFKLLGEFLGLEPMNIPTQLPQNNAMPNVMPQETDKGDETEEEDDEAPELVNA